MAVVGVATVVAVAGHNNAVDVLVDPVVGIVGFVSAPYLEVVVVDVIVGSLIGVAITTFGGVVVFVVVPHFAPDLAVHVVAVTGDNDAVDVLIDSVIGVVGFVGAPYLVL